ncbi:MAG: cytidylate kinase-like family protein [Nitrospirae bacterium]|nr:cytidylate kinase-like family protein [Magnetococcales bacterium]
MSTGDSGINGMVLSSFFKEQENSAGDQQRPVVTVSRGLGCNGGVIGNLLANRLGVDCFGYSMFDRIVKETQADSSYMSLVDERCSSVMDNFFLSFITSGKSSSTDYMQRLVKIIYAIYKSGGVIIGRGAHLILGNKPNIFRLRIEGSPDICAKRLAEREHLDIAIAKERIKKVDEERVNFVREVYKYFPRQNRSYYNLSINSDNLESADIVDIALFAMKKQGIKVPSV